MITICTHSRNLLTIEAWKAFLRKALHKYTGPDAVRDSLMRGLQLHGMAFELNPRKPAGGIVIVLSGVRVLQEQLKRKQRGEITLLIAGPNIVVLPHEESGVVLNKDIDYLLLPSEWNAELWRQQAPELAAKIVVWPAGVPQTTASTRTGPAIVYDKMSDRALTTYVSHIVKRGGKKELLFRYGNHTHGNYLAALACAPYVIFLSRSESQGIALQEAWAHDVPTFVNKSTTWESGRIRMESELINAPYLTPEIGGVFASPEELIALTTRAHTFHPKRYCDKFLSDYASTALLLPYITKTSSTRREVS